MSCIKREDFQDYLRACLGHLHDPYRLRRSPLAGLFGVASRHDTPSALRHVLTEAIASLEPDPDTPDDSRAWRIYEAMYYRYVEQFSQEEVADQMGLSARQVRREQRAALEALAYQLWSQFDLGSQAVSYVKEDAEAVSPPSPGEATVSQEAAWLQGGGPDATAELQGALTAVRKLVRPLAGMHNVVLDVQVGCALPEVAVDPVALRQILLNLLSVAIAHAGDTEGRVGITVDIERGDVTVRIRSRGTTTTAELAAVDANAKLSLAAQLAELAGCGLQSRSEADVFLATVTLAAVAQVPVLVVDDNAGTLQLVRRYLTGTRYRLIEVQNPEEAVPIAAEASPAVIVIDVMMPRVDGWEILGRLREHPETRHIPIMVCTILAQKELALALGASAFVQKPFTRQAFLEALDRWVPQMRDEPEMLPS